MSIRSIVVGTDGSKPSYRAFAMAVGLAVREQGCVHACFVSHVPGAAALGGFFAPVPLVGDAESDDNLARFVAQELGQASVRGDFTCRSGEVAAELELLAEDCKADLVVVGRSAHPPLLLGGVPRQLLARGRFPILVVPGAGPASLTAAEPAAQRLDWQLVSRPTSAQRNGEVAVRYARSGHRGGSEESHPDTQFARLPVSLGAPGAEGLGDELPLRGADLVSRTNVDECLFVSGLGAQAELRKPCRELVSLALGHRPAPFDRTVAVLTDLSVVDAEGSAGGTFHTRQRAVLEDCDELLAQGPGPRQGVRRNQIGRAHV